MKAVVWDGEFTIRDDITANPLRSRDVLVRMMYAGVCHSDLSATNGTINLASATVMGHEGAGVVEAVGDGVSSVAPGDHVVIVPFGSCGQCAACDVGAPSQCAAPDGGGAGGGRMSAGEGPIAQFANIGAYAHHAVLFETQCVRIEPDVPLSVACLLSCALLTGYGAVTHRARVRPGDTVAVIGAGGIGQAAIQAARLSSAARIVVVDVNESKRDIAMVMGATDFVVVGVDELAAEVTRVVPGGVDFVFECVGAPDLVRAGFAALAVGGTEVMLGIGKADAEVTVPSWSLYFNRGLVGSRMGNAQPHRDIPLLADFYRRGQLLLDEMVTKVYPIDDVATAFADLSAGKLNRGVLSFEGWEAP